MNLGLSSEQVFCPSSGNPAPRFLVTVILPLAAALFMGCLVVFAGVNALYLAISILTCVLILLDFRIGVVCLTLLLPISASLLMPRSISGISGLNPLNLLLLVTLLTCLLQGLPKGSLSRLLPRPLIWCYLLPILVGGILGARHVGEIPSFFRSEDMVEFSNATGYIRDMVIKPTLFMVMFGVLMGAAALRCRQPEKLIYAMLASIWVMGLTTIALVLLSGIGLGELAGSQSRAFFAPLGLHANDLGRLYAMAYALMLFTFAASDDLRLRTALAASMAMVVVALMLTFSRSAFIGFILVNGLFLISRRRLGIILIGALLFVLLALILPGAVYERLETGWGGGLNAITAGRVDDIWLPLLPEIMESPIWGHGLGSTMWSAAMRSGRILEVTHPHNAYLQALMDLGVVGLVLLFSYFVHVWRGFRSLRDDPNLSPTLRGFFSGAMAGLTGFLVTGMSGSSLVPGLEQVFLWFAIGMMYALQPPRQEAQS